MSVHPSSTIALIGLPPQVALLGTLGFMFLLFRRDIRERPSVTGALWLPLVWLTLICSRPVSEWLHIFGLPVSVPQSVEEGSPLDAFIFLALLVVGFCVLLKRQVNLAEIFRDNGWLIAFLVYCFISITWSDYPFISFKRWIKGLGHPIMALIVLTETDPEEAFTGLMKRCAYVIVPVSILFIKYYPQLGAYYDQWTGMAMYKGIAVHKNMLGADCMILGLFFFWYLIQIWRLQQSRWRTRELWLAIGFLLMISWLFRKMHSATGAICLLAGVMLIMLVRVRSVKRHIGTWLLTAATLIMAAELAVGISGQLSETFGRGSSLSGRTVLWMRLLGLHTNPVFGTGFESFWLGERVDQLQGIFFFIPNEAHNGYLEIYLNLGLIGLLLLTGFMMVTFWRIRLDLFQNFEWGRYRLAYFGAVALYNLTEAGFRFLNPIWFVFYLIAMEYPRTHLANADESLGIARLEEGEDSVYVAADTYWGADHPNQLYRPSRYIQSPRKTGGA
jgi:exopolysaccharide production protein ExoQ